MPKDYIWIELPDGSHEHVSYDELDSDILHKLFKPIGGFCYKADEYVHLQLPKVPYYIKDWLPKQGKTLLYAPAKAGKSFISQQIARCIGSGEEFLGIPTSKGRVLLLQFELGEEVLQYRFRLTGKDYEDVYLGTTFSMKLDTEGGQKQLWTALEAVKPDVLILDPFYKLIKGEENDSHDVGVITDFLDDTIEAFGCSILITHHTGKDISRGSRGSSVLEGWVDSYIEQKRISKTGEPLRIRVTPKLLRHAELPPDAIEAELKNFEFEQLSTEGSPTVKDRVKEYVKTVSAGGLTASPKDLEDADLGSHKAISLAINTLLKDGIITRVARGEYKSAP